MNRPAAKFVRLLAPLLLVLVAAAARAEADLPALGKAIAKLSAGPAAGKKRPESPGHLKLVEEAEARAALAADGRAVGWIFGESRFEYDPSGAGEEAIRINFERAQCPVSSAKKGEPIRIRADRALWLTAAAAEAPTGESPEPDAPTKRLLDRFAQTRMMGGIEIEPAILLAEGILAGRPKATVVVIDAKASYYFWFFDPENDEESLFWAYEHLPAPNGLEGWLTPYRLDRRPLARGRRPAPAPPIELRDLDVRVDEAGSEWGAFRTTEEWVARRPTSLLRLRLDEADFGFQTEQVHYTIRFTNLVVVSDSAGNRLPAFRNGSGLLVALPRPLAAGESVRIVAIYGFSLRHPWGDQYWRLAEQAWYPMARDLRSNWTTFHAVVRAKKPFLSFATGRTVSRSTDGDFVVLETRQETPVMFPSIIAGRFFPVEIEGTGDVKVTVATYGMERPEGAKKLGKLVAAFLEVGTKLLGPQPSKEIAVVEIREWGWGQAPDGFIQITQEAFNPVINDIGGTYIDFLKGGVNERIAHEVSHAWWGHITRTPAEQDQWLEESTAELTAATLLGATKSKSDYDKLTGYWKARGSEVPDRVSIADANLLHWDQEKTYRFNLLYCRGPWALHVMRQEMGDQVFFTILRSYLRSFAGKSAGTDDLAGLAGYVTKKDWKPWFESYVWGAKIP